MTHSCTPERGACPHLLVVYHFCIFAKTPSVCMCMSCRDFGSASQGPCAIVGNPSVPTITGSTATGTTLQTANCNCKGAGQCAAVSSSSFSTNATGWGSATLNGALSALPFSKIKNETCFATALLDTATDTYRVSRQTCWVLPCCNPGAIAHNTIVQTMMPNTLTLTAVTVYTCSA